MASYVPAYLWRSTIYSVGFESARERHRSPTLTIPIKIEYNCCKSFQILFKDTWLQQRKPRGADRGSLHGVKNMCDYGLSYFLGSWRIF